MNEIEELNKIVEQIFSNPRFKKILYLFYANIRLRGYNGKIEFRFYRYQGDGSSVYDSLYAGNEYVSSEKLDKKLFDFVYGEIDKIMSFVDDMSIDEELIGSIDYDSINNEVFELTFDFKEKEFIINHDISYYEVNYQQSEQEFDELNDQTKEEIDEFCSANVFLTVSFNGSGDSGHIDENGYNQDSEQFPIPGGLEDTLYGMLSNYGGWEINEGSQGEFTISCAQKLITLEYGENYEESRNKDIFKINFDTDYEL